MVIGDSSIFLYFQLLELIDKIPIQVRLLQQIANLILNLPLDLALVLAGLVLKIQSWLFVFSSLRLLVQDVLPGEDDFEVGAAALDRFKPEVYVLSHEDLCIGYGHQ